MVARVLTFAVAAALAGLAAPPAFPGAEGFGAATRGGRGGRVLLVTNLNDSGPGTLRAAIAEKGPRMVVFRTGGIIDLESPLTVREPYLTIAGQTAPGDGICLRGDALAIETHDVIVRYLRVRPGDVRGRTVDAISIGGEARDVILDHVSAGWSIDESLSPSGAVRNITVQWSIIAEALNRSIHEKGPHGYGSLARAVGGVTFHHNLWAHNDSRNPRLGDNYGRPPYPTFDVRNNVIYDYGAVCSGMTGDNLSANYVGNYIRPGPSSNSKRAPIVLTDKAAVRYYVSGNIVEGRPQLSGEALFDSPERKGRRLLTLVERPFETPPVRTTSAEQALEDVLAGAGAILPARDSVDARVVKQVRERGGRIIDSQKQVGGWPEYKAGTAPPDTDSDGMPDEWEKAHGLNPRSGADAGADRDGDGYTNIEEYVNGLARSAR